jgi:alpha-ketoglutarate-dependent taurine dioxygenase
MRLPTPSALPPLTRVIVPGKQVRLIQVLAESIDLGDESLHDRATQLAWRRLVSDRLGAAWAEPLARLQNSLDHSPYAVLVRPENSVRSEALLVALAASLGIMADPYRAAWSRVLQQIRKRDDRSATDVRWHTDSPGWVRPNNITCLLCVSPAAAGGNTELLPWPSVCRALRAAPGLLDRLATCQVPWVLDSALGCAEVREPVLTETGIRYMREAFERAAGAHPDQAATVNGLYSSTRELLDAATDFHSLRLAAGDVLIFDNRRCLHRRGPLDDEAGQERILVRVRLEEPSWGRAVACILPWMDHHASERRPTGPASSIGAAAP